VIRIGIINLIEANQPIPAAARVRLVVKQADAAYRLVVVGRVGYIFVYKREVRNNGLLITSKVEFPFILLTGLL
jgi:hypothetical protein